MQFDRGLFDDSFCAVWFFEVCCIWMFAFVQASGSGGNGHGWSWVVVMGGGWVMVGSG